MEVKASEPTEDWRETLTFDCDVCGKKIVGIKNMVNAGDKVVCSENCKHPVMFDGVYRKDMEIDFDEIFGKVVTYDVNTFLLMDLKKDLIKQYHIKFSTTIWNDENIVWLNRLIVPKKHRMKGLGTTIMKSFVKWLDKNRYDSKLLVANCYGTPTDVLIRFYKSFGYTIDESSNNIYMTRLYRKD